MPGAAAVKDLIMELDKTFELESWELRNTIPYGDKAKVRRVNTAGLGWGKPPASPLRHEVQPEEVVLPVLMEPVYDEDDDDSVRSTDPLHPITTNYEVFCAGIDDDYLEFLTEEGENAAQLEHDAEDPFATSWDWDSEVTGSANGFEPSNHSINSSMGSKLLD